MAKRKRTRLPRRKDGVRRTKRQRQTLVNNRNFRARKFYDKVRPKWKDELVALRRTVRELKYGLADVTRRYHEKCEEVVALSSKRSS